MFGHQDNAVNDIHPAEPVADGTLSNDTNATFAPTSTPVVASDPPTPPTPTAPPVIDDAAASDYILTDAPHTAGDTQPTAPSEGTANDDLLNIKQQALQQLSPLVGHLEQTPEEKFRTTMMMIQASDDQSLVGAAYDAAKEITDEKARAQALLDVVNEINYFTQHQTAA